MEQTFDSREFSKSYAIAYLEAAINELQFHDDPEGAKYKIDCALAMLAQVAQEKEILAEIVA